MNKLLHQLKNDDESAYQLLLADPQEIDKLVLLTYATQDVVSLLNELKT